MLFTQKLGIAVSGILLGFAVVILPSEKSTAKTVFSNKNTPTILANVEIGNQQLISCLMQQRSPLSNAVELLMRLLVIGSFGSVTIAGSSSLVQRYLHIINRDYIVIVYCVTGLILIMVMSSVIIFLSSSRYQIAVPSCPKNISLLK
jgi:hypothetical protein